MIRFECDSCSKKLKVPEKYSNRKVKCPSCEHILIVPEAEPQVEEPAVESDADSSGYGLRDALSSLEGGEAIEVERPVKQPEQKAANPEYSTSVPMPAKAKKSSDPSESSIVLKAVIFSVLLASIGSFAWALLAKYTGYEIGYLAWGIGGLAGAGVLMSGAEKCRKLGVIAAVVAVCAIIGGKALVFSWVYDDVNVNININDQSDAELLELLEDEDVLAFVGIMAIMSPEFQDKIDQGIDTDAEWDQLEFDAQQEVLTWDDQQKIDHTRNAADKLAEIFSIGSKSEFMGEGVMASLGFMDIIFFGLAIATAYKLGDGG